MTHLTFGIDIPVNFKQSPFTDALNVLLLKVMTDSEIRTVLKQGFSLY